MTGNHRGTPQGGVISPLLANLYLNSILLTAVTRQTTFTDKRFQCERLAAFDVRRLFMPPAPGTRSHCHVPLPLSDAESHTLRMNNRLEQITDERQNGLVAEFGEACLTRENGRLHLRGGSMADRMEALEWAAMFLPDEAPFLRR